MRFYSQYAGFWLAGLFLLFALPCSAAGAAVPLGYHGPGIASRPIPPGYSTFAIQIYAETGMVPVTNLFFTVPIGPTTHALVDDIAIIRVNEGGVLEANRFSTNSGWANPAMQLLPGAGYFVYNPTTNTCQFGMGGGFISGNFTNYIPAGLSLCSCMVPQGGPLSTVLLFPAVPGDQVWLYNNSTATYLNYIFTETGWVPEEPTVPELTAFWVMKAAPAVWSRFAPDVFSGNSEPSVVRAEQIAVTDPLPAPNIFPLPLPAPRLQKMIAGVGDILTFPPATVSQTNKILGWSKNGTALEDGVKITGSATNSLGISPLASGDSGTYTLAVSNQFGITLASVISLEVMPPAPTPPVITLSNPGQPNLLQGSSLVAGYHYRLQYSADLRSWQDLTNSNASASSITALDTNAPPSGRRFYRLISP
jgi:hypothetical protein